MSEKANASFASDDRCVTVCLSKTKPSVHIQVGKAKGFKTQEVQSEVPLNNSKPNVSPCTSFLYDPQYISSPDVAAIRTKIHISPAKGSLNCAYNPYPISQEDVIQDENSESSNSSCPLTTKGQYKYIDADKQCPYYRVKANNKYISSKVQTDPCDLNYYIIVSLPKESTGSFTSKFPKLSKKISCKESKKSNKYNQPRSFQSLTETESNNAPNQGIQKYSIETLNSHDILNSLAKQPDVIKNATLLGRNDLDTIRNPLIYQTHTTQTVKYLRHAICGTFSGDVKQTKNVSAAFNSQIRKITIKHIGCGSENILCDRAKTITGCENEKFTKNTQTEIFCENRACGPDTTTNFQDVAVLCHVDEENKSYKTIGCGSHIYIDLVSVAECQCNTETSNQSTQTDSDWPNLTPGLETYQYCQNLKLNKNISITCTNENEDLPTRSIACGSQDCSLQNKPSVTKSSCGDNRSPKLCQGKCNVRDELAQKAIKSLQCEQDISNQVSVRKICNDEPYKTMQSSILQVTKKISTDTICMAECASSPVTSQNMVNKLQKASACQNASCMNIYRTIYLTSSELEDPSKSWRVRYCDKGSCKSSSEKAVGNDKISFDKGVCYKSNCGDKCNITNNQFSISTNTNAAYHRVDDTKSPNTSNSKENLNTSHCFDICKNYIKENSKNEICDVPDCNVKICDEYQEENPEGNLCVPDCNVKIGDKEEISKENLCYSDCNINICDEHVKKNLKENFGVLDCNLNTCNKYAKRNFKENVVVPDCNTKICDKYAKENFVVPDCNVKICDEYTIKQLKENVRAPKRNVKICDEYAKKNFKAKGVPDCDVKICDGYAKKNLKENVCIPDCNIEICDKYSNDYSEESLCVPDCNIDVCDTYTREYTKDDIGNPDSSVDISNTDENTEEAMCIVDCSDVPECNNYSRRTPTRENICIPNCNIAVCDAYSADPKNNKKRKVSPKQTCFSTGYRDKKQKMMCDSSNDKFDKNNVASHYENYISNYENAKEENVELNALLNNMRSCEFSTGNIQRWDPYCNECDKKLPYLHKENIIQTQTSLKRREELYYSNSDKSRELNALQLHKEFYVRNCKAQRSYMKCFVMPTLDEKPCLAEIEPQESSESSSIEEESYLENDCERTNSSSQVCPEKCVETKLNKIDISELEHAVNAYMKSNSDFMEED